MGTPNNWATPEWLFKALDLHYHFKLDVCAEEWNAKCERYWSIDDNGLEQPWTSMNWLNPPYSGEYPIADWLARSVLGAKRGKTTVALLKNDPSTRWYRDYVLQASKIMILTGGRVQFDPPPGVKASSCAFPSIVVEFLAGAKGMPDVFHVDVPSLRQEPSLLSTLLLCYPSAVGE